MIQKVDHQKESAARAIQKIQNSAYLIEAELMGFDGIPQLKETILEIQNSNEIFWGYMEKSQLTGFISFKIENKTIDIHRLAVCPKHFRKGIARKLLAYLLKYFQEMNMVVSTGKANMPAKNLYKSLGFIEIRDFEVAPGIFCTVLEKRRHS